MRFLPILPILISYLFYLTFSQNDTLGLSSGYLDFETSKLNIKIVNDSQVLASLAPKFSHGFDLLPFEHLRYRAGNGQHHIGDLVIRYRAVGQSTWTTQDTAASRHPVKAKGRVTSSNVDFTSANLSATLNSSILNVIRRWSDKDGDLVLSFDISNDYFESIELGSIGFPLESDNIFKSRTAEDINANCSLTDPNIGLNGGYVRITRINGQGPAIVITPLNKDTALEGWDYLTESSGSLSYGSGSYEGNYQWMTHTKANAEMEWSQVDPWNAPTSKVLAKGDTLTVGLRFSTLEDIDQIESSLRVLELPVARSLPGYIIPQDMSAYLEIDAPSGVQSMEIEPTGAFEVRSSLSPVMGFVLTPGSTAFGRVRVTVSYIDGTKHTAHYHISKPGHLAVYDVGRFFNDRHWWEDRSDFFRRAPTFMPVDHSDGVGSLMLQNNRTWLVGECHEAGASWMPAAIKQVAQPNEDEISKLETFVSETLWGRIQLSDYSVKQSLFWYDPKLSYAYDPKFNWVLSTPTHYSDSWELSRANATGRTYGYTYPITAYWSLYRVARAYPVMIKRFTWSWYLNQAYQTAKYCFEAHPNGTHLHPLWFDGLMGETVIGEVLKDLYREGWTDKALELEVLMRARSDLWEETAVPFGSELGWDCTGEEGLFYWSNYFNRTSTVEKTINAIRGYTPMANHWGYNGNSRRYWDFHFDGKIDRPAERQIHHYGSSLNALAMQGYYRTLPESYNSKSKDIILRLAFAGMFAPLSNIHQDGFASAAFHSWANTLAWDNLTGDYGLSFIGLVLGSATYVIDDPKYDGIFAFGGEVTSITKNEYTIQPRDAVRKKVLLSPMSLFIEIDAGAIESVHVDGTEVTLSISSAVFEKVAKASEAILWLNQDFYANGTPKFTMTGCNIRKKRGGWSIPLERNLTMVTISADVYE